MIVDVILPNYPALGKEDEVMLLPFEEIVIRAIMVKQQADADFERQEHMRRKAEEQERIRNPKKKGKR